MNLITVIPLSRSKVAPELSYFTAADVPVGAIVSVPLRSKSIHGIVMKTEKAADQKTRIKKADFVIRKLNKVRATSFFPASFMEACAELADFYATTAGAVIDSLVSDVLLANASKIAPPLPPQASFDMAHDARFGPSRQARPRAESDRVFAVQGDDADRLSSWRSLIRQEFARKRSIVMYVPTIEDCDQLFAALEKGIEGYIFKLNSSLTKKKTLDTWKSISEAEHPVVVIATGSFSQIPRDDVESVVIERENGRGWIGQKAPYLDLRHALVALARKKRQTVFLADSILRAETLYRIDMEEIDHGSPFKWRSVSDARDTLVDMRVYRSADNNFKILSPELEDLIRTANETNTHVFVMTARRGSATTIVCDDCETIVVCRNCGAPVVLHAPQNPAANGTAKNFFMCHRCGERRPADESCAVCGGWRLTALGIGLDRVSEEIKKRFPGIEVLQVDAEATKTEKEISDALKRFRELPGSVLLGTELALLRLSALVDHVAVVSLDSLLALPDFRVSERIMYALTRLRALAARSILVQTRKPEEKVFEYGLKGNLSDFYRLTLSERKQFSYPPFGLLVKISIEGKKDAIAEQMAGIQKLVAPRELDIFPAYTASARGNSQIHGLLKIEPHAWPDPDLVSKLRSLPPNVSVKINPESLL